MVSNNYSNYSYYGYNNGQSSGPTSMLGSSDPAGINDTLSGISETYQNALNPQQTKKSSGGIGGFFNGLVNGAKNMMSSLMSPQGLLMAGAAAALTFVFPPAGIALLAVGGISAGAQIAKGVSSGNMEQVGEGVFGLGMTALGARGMGGALKGKDGLTYTAAGGKSAKAADAAKAAANQADDAAAAAKAANAKAAANTADDAAKAAAKAADDAAAAAAKKADDLLALQIKAESRAQFSGMAKVDQTKLVSSTKPTPEALASAKTQLGQARSNLSNAKFDLAQHKVGDPGYAAAKQAVDAAETAFNAQKSALNQMELIMQSQRGHVGKTVDSVKDAFSILKGDKLVGPDGKTITLYNRGKAPDKAAAASTADDAAAASKSTTAASTADDAAAATAEKSTGWFQSAKDKANGLLTPTKDTNGNVITTGTTGYLNHIRQNPGTTILNGHFLQQGTGLLG